MKKYFLSLFLLLFVFPSVVNAATKVGRLYIPSVGISVTLYNSTAQSVTDANDSANYWNNYGYSIIADHVHQAFANLKNVRAGTTAYIDYTDGSRVNLIAIEAFAGRNNDSYFSDGSGNYVDSSSHPGSFMTYTCHPHHPNIWIVIWNVSSGNNPVNNDPQPVVPGSGDVVICEDGYCGNDVNVSRPNPDDDDYPENVTDGNDGNGGNNIPGSEVEVNPGGSSGGEGCESVSYSVRHYGAGGSATLEDGHAITQYIYDLNGIESYCMHAASATPVRIDSKCAFDLNSSRDKAITAMYTYARRTGASIVSMNDAVRVFVAEVDGKDGGSDFHPYSDDLTSSQLISLLRDYGSKIKSGEVTGAVADIYCTGLVTAGLGSCGGAEAIDLIDNTELEFTDNIVDNNNTNDFFYRTIELSFDSGGKYDIEILNDNLKIYDNLEYAVILPDNFVGRHADNDKISFVIKSRRNVIHDDGFSDLGIDFSYKKIYKEAYYQLYNATCQGAGCAKLSQWDGNVQELFFGEVLEDDTIYNYSYRTDVPKSCNPDNVIGNKQFNVTGYIDNGCCLSVDPSTLSGSDLEHYNLMCKDEDNSHFINNCGDDSNCVNEDNQLVVDKGANTEPYSTSTIGQKSLEDVMRSVVYKHANMDTFYRQDNVIDHLDKEFNYNTYCMMYTSEDLTINLPTTTQGKSGEIFTFMNYYDEECLQDLNASVNECFRQPNLDGKLYFNYYIAKERYDSDMRYYDEVISYYAESKDGLYANGAANRSKANTNKADAQTQYNQCVNAKNAWDWDYDLQGGMTFTYQQEIDNSEAQNEPIRNTVTYDMTAVPSTDEPVKFWPNVSTETSYETKNCNDNGCAGLAKKHLYYRPSQVAYQIMDNGRIVLEDAYQYSAPGVENGIEVGYVYTINLTTKQGEYETKFGLSDIGHRGSNSNLNRVFNRIDSSEGSPLDQFSTCTFCNTYSTITRQCETCPTSENLILNIISNDNVLAADRQGISTNWTDDDVKGVAARYAIESAATSNIAIINSVDDRYLSLAGKDEVQKIEDDRTFLADVYNDSTKESLEYEITLSPDIMTKIRNNTRHSEYTYDALQVCNATHQFTTEMNEDTLYCYSCTEDAKECQGSFIDTYFSYKEGRNKYKYFKYDPNTGTGEFKVGKISTLPDIFANGRYPDPELKEAYIYNYKNWP